MAKRRTDKSNPKAILEVCLFWVWGRFLLEFFIRNIYISCKQFREIYMRLNFKVRSFWQLWQKYPKIMDSMHLPLSSDTLYPVIE